MEGPEGAGDEAEETESAVRFQLLIHGRGQPSFGQLGEERRAQDARHHGAVTENDERKDQVKFLRKHPSFSAAFLRMLQDEVPNLPKTAPARLLMPGMSLGFC